VSPETAIPAALVVTEGQDGKVDLTDTIGSEDEDEDVNEEEGLDEDERTKIGIITM
jgi:hypothetical protein